MRRRKQDKELKHVLIGIHKILVDYGRQKAARHWTESLYAERGTPQRVLVNEATKTANSSIEDFDLKEAR